MIRRYTYNFIAIILKTIEKLTGFEILVHKKNFNSAKSSARYLAETINYIRQIANFKPKNVFEIGANYGQDADFLRSEFGLANNNVYVFEPQPELFNKIKDLYSFNCYDFAISNKNKKIIFHTIELGENKGISSLKIHKCNDKKIYKDIMVSSIRMDGFIKKNHIKTIDFLKVDVEGLTHEVLSGFGKTLQIVKSIQIETEFLPIWQNQKTWGDIYKILLANNFQLVDYRLQEDGIQADSFWIQKKYVKHKVFDLAREKWQILR